MLEQQDMSGSWLTRLRSDASRRLEQLPFPAGTEEAWRFTELGLLDPGQFTATTRPAILDSAPGAAGEAALLSRLEQASSGGLVVRVDARLHSVHLDAELRRAGVLLMDLDQAAREHGDLLREHLGRLVGPDDYFTTRALAHGSGGVLLHVPPGAELSAPVRIMSWYTATTAGRVIHPRHVIVVGRGAKLILDDVHASESAAAGRSPTMVAPVVELFVDQGASVSWVTSQELGRGFRHLAHLKARLERDARLEATVLSLGADYSRTRQEVVLDGVGASSLMLGAYFPTGSQRVEHWTVQDHRAPRTRSDLLHLGTLSGDAQAVYNGTIRIQPQAAHSDAYQSNRNLVLTPSARATTNPQLEISNNDVRCTHGATVGPLDEEALFYLMSRGIPRREAGRLVVQGFFGRLLQRMSWSGASERLAAAVKTKTGEAT